MPPTKNLDIAGQAGRLEAVLMTPDVAPVAAGVVCHAHPLHGGMMHFKVVFRAAKALQNLGVVALRFNFRGVGRSEGVHDNGSGEQDDVRAALDELERLYPELPVILGGYSFGSLMALRVGCSDSRVRALFAIGFPVNTVSDVRFVDACRKPCLFVQGEEDEFGRGEQIRELVSRSRYGQRVGVISNADHFFTDRLVELQKAVEAWIAERPWEARGQSSAT